MTIVDAGAGSTVSAGLLATKHDGNLLRVEWSDAARSSFHALWLRDNCRCEDCGKPETGRRKLRLTDLDLGVTLVAAEILTADRVEIRWSDGHRGSFSGAWLRANSYDEQARRNRCFGPRIWDDGLRRNPPTMAFSAVNGSDHAFLEMLHTVRDVGLCFLHGAPAAPGHLESFARKIGPIQESNFGRVLDLVVDKTKRSVANRTIALKAHTDEPYRASPPGLLMFHCIETDVKGAGASIFVDGFEIAEMLRAEDSAGFAALSRHAQPYRRYFEGDVDLISEFPIISVDEFGNLLGVRINDRVAAPLILPAAEVSTFYRGLRRLLQLSESDDRTLFRPLRPGDMAIFDNHRILHGRTELTMTGRRWLQWVQVERGDFHSKLRILADNLGQHRDAASLLRGAYG
jgi:gamma-butyrobetaine dioxygenase